MNHPDTPSHPAHASPTPARVLEVALASTGAGVVVADSAGRILQLSPRAAELTGWSEAQALGRPLEDVFAGEGPDAGSALATWVRSRLAEGAAPVLRRRIALVSRLGARADVELSTARLEAEGGQPAAHVLVLRDLKRLVDAEAQSRRADERFRLVVDLAPNGLMMVDAQGVITLANPKAEAMFGYGPGELAGVGIEALVPEASRGAHRAFVQGLFSAPQGRRMGEGRDLHGRRRDGSEFPVEIGLEPLATPEGPAMLASVIDITDRKRRDDELRRSNADLEQFAYVASHDLQEPLRMVASYAELLGQRYKGQLDERADKYIFYAVDGARRMQRLVADLLAFARVESQGQAPAPVDAAQVLAQVLHVLGPAVREAGATVEAGDMPRVLVDEGQLGQLLQNLLGNALKFRSEAPPVIRVQARRERDQWVFSVHDNGIGIDLRHAERIFQMFQRLHERGRYDGSGIGLAIAKRIVERNGGRIWVESAPGAGSSFHFTLRAAPAAPGAS